MKLCKKIKITQEQEKAINSLLHLDGINGNICMAIEYYADVIYDKLNEFICEFKPLNTMPKYKVIKALIEGYEVERSFKVGDWVVDDYGGVMIVQYTEENGVWIMKYKEVSPSIWVDFGSEQGSKLRHATPEEIVEEIAKEKTA